MKCLLALLLLSIPAMAQVDGNAQHAGWIDPTSNTFGAKCDGSTDDSIALQRAFNAVPPVGGTIYIPGHCTFATALTIPTTPLTNNSGNTYGGIVIRGAGTGVSALQYTGTSGNAIGATVGLGSAGWDLTIRDLTVEDDSAVFNGQLIFAQNINRVVIDNVVANCLYDIASANTCGVYLKAVAGCSPCFGDVVTKLHGSGISVVFDGVSDSILEDSQIYPQAFMGGRTWQGLTLPTSASLSLGGNWGTSPSSALSPVSTDKGGGITVTSGSGTPGANPTVTLTFAEGVFSAVPICIGYRRDINPPLPTTAPWIATSISTSAVTWTFTGTPTAATNYLLDYTCGVNIR